MAAREGGVPCPGPVIRGLNRCRPEGRPGRLGRHVPSGARRIDSGEAAVKRCLIVIVLALGAAAPATAATLPAGGPRDVYERSLGDPPRVYEPPGALGHDWRGTPP